MPNWCENKLFISSDNEEQLIDFVNKVKDPENNTDLSLSKLFPCPKELLELDTPNRSFSYDECGRLIMNYGYSNWLDWSIENWGTKWDIHAKLVIKNYGFALYEFESAWSPPTGWIAAASLQYTDLCFRLKYDEPGIGFMGVCTAVGKNISDQCIDYR